MDAFRRFRSRRKSKGQADGFTSFADAESNYRSGSSAWQSSTTHSPGIVPHKSDGIGTDSKVIHDQFKQPKSPIEQRQPGSSSRIQPLLIGISRPFTADSRPGTAESMQKALDRAAESINTQQVNGNGGSKAQLGLRTGRHVDIVSISKQESAPMKTYNEDIAERNLDAAAPSIKEQQTLYEPASKYQEEVANRNSHQIAAQRLSSLRRRTEERVKGGHDRSASSQTGSYTNRPSTTEAMSGRRNQEQTDMNARTSSSRAREAPEHLPIIPQELSSENLGLIRSKTNEIRQAERDLERAKARWNETRKRIHEAADVDKPLPASPRQRETMRDSGIASYVDSVKRSSDLLAIEHARKLRQENTNGSKHLSSRTNGHIAQQAGRLTVLPGPQMPVIHVQGRDRYSDGSRRTDESLRPSDASNASTYLKVTVGNRTIMDLTGEDDVEIISVASYMQTPIIEDVRSDAFIKVIPTVVDHSPPRMQIERDSVIPNSRWSSALEPVLDLDQLARRSQAISDTAKRLAAESRFPSGKIDTKSAPPAPAPAPAYLTFSTIKTLTSPSTPKTITYSVINTLGSTSPRASQEVLPVDKHMTNIRPVPHITPEIVVNGRLQVPRNEKNPSANTRLSANIVPLVQVFADVKPEESTLSRQPSPDNPTNSRSDSGGRKVSKESGLSSRKQGKQRERFEEKESIRIAAKSIVPAGPLDHEPLSGVKARDFALTPLDRPTNKRVEAIITARRKGQPESAKSTREPSRSSKSSSSERKGRSRSAKAPSRVAFTESITVPTVSTTKPEKPHEKKIGKKTGKQLSRSARKPRPKSVFDEKAFEKKHAEANAALLRLQQSLQDSLEDDLGHTVAHRETVIPVNRALSPADSVVRGGSPLAVRSPSEAAIAMITVATSSPRNLSKSRLHSKASTELVKQARKTKPSLGPRSNTDGDLSCAKQAGTSAVHIAAIRPLLAQADGNNPPPPSPGEVSLSAFPIPTPRALSPEVNNGPPAYVKDVGTPARRDSQASRMSSASVFSIPSGMVPNRMGSLPENRIGVPGPTAPPHMESINAIIPATRSAPTTRA